MAKAVGIDLGTTNSVVAVLEGGEPTVIPNAEGSRTTPSVVAFSKSAEILVGEVAKRQAITNPDRTVRSIKREMGRKDWTLDVDGKKWTPQEISAQILAKLRRDAESYLGDKVTQAVITVPAYFDDAQRQATKEAGQIAGLEVLRIINEPTAAALAYGLDKQHDQTILVFDLGGGTFDVSLLEIGEGVFEVKATHGDTQLGGDDWDQRVIDWMVKEFKNNYGIDLAADRMAMQRLKEAAEKAKIELSQVTEATINLPFISAGAEGPLHLEMKLTRSEFERMTEDLVQRCRDPFDLAVKDWGKSVDAIGIVNVSAKDMATGKEQAMTITGGTALSKEDIDRMVADAEKFATEDHRRREAAEARNAGDQIAYQVDRSLEEWGDKVPEADREELKKLNEELKESLKGEDADRIKSGTDVVMAKFQSIGQAMYQQTAQSQTQQAAAAGGGAPSNPGTDGDNEVVEGEIVDEGGGQQ